MFARNSKEEAMLYYLYMMADGDVSYSEEKLFDNICKDLSLSDEVKREVIEICRSQGKETKDMLSIIIREMVDKKVERGFFGLKASITDLSRVIWNLINLGYADAIYSDEEKKIVKYLVDKWSIKSEIIQEFIDTADTILALTKQKEWIIATFDKGPDRDAKERNVDTQISQMFDDIKVTINEISM